MSFCVFLNCFVFLSPSCTAHTLEMENVTNQAGHEMKCDHVHGMHITFVVCVFLFFLCTVCFFDVFV